MWGTPARPLLARGAEHHEFGASVRDCLDDRLARRTSADDPRLDRDAVELGDCARLCDDAARLRLLVGHLRLERQLRGHLDRRQDAHGRAAVGGEPARDRHRLVAVPGLVDRDENAAVRLERTNGHEFTVDSTP